MNDVYEIYVATSYQWVLEGSTTDKQIAKETVRTIRAGGRNVMVYKNGKKISWRI